MLCIVVALQHQIVGIDYRGNNNTGKSHLQFCGGHSKKYSHFMSIPRTASAPHIVNKSRRFEYVSHCYNIKISTFAVNP